MNRILFSLYLVTFIVSFFLQISALLTPSWVEVKSETFSLTTCISCKGLKTSWTFSCLARESCKNKEETCSTYNNLFNSGKLFIYLQIFSIFCGVIVFEKQLLMFFHIPIGNLLFFYIFSFLHWSSSFCSLLAWFSLSSTEYSSTLKGSKLIISSLIISFISYSFAAIPIYKQNQQNFILIELQKPLICKIHSKLILILAMIFGVVSLCLIYAGVVHQNWVVFKDFKGNAWKCENCLDFKNADWVCSQHFFCEIDEKSEECKTFKRLSRASDVFFPLETISVLFLILSFQPGAASLKSMHYGWKYISQVYITIAFLASLSGTLAYVGITGLSFSGSCDENACADGGFVFILISNFFIAGCWVLDFTARKKVQVSKFFISPKDYCSTDRRELAVEDEPHVQSENSENDQQDSEVPSRRSSASQLLKFNTPNPEYEEPINEQVNND